MKKIKRVSSVLLMLLLVLGMFPMTAAATTQQEAVNWVLTQEGKRIDYDGAKGPQCVDLIMKYCHKMFGVWMSGNGCDYRDYCSNPGHKANTVPAGWTRTKYAEGDIPRPGDIIVYIPQSPGYTSKYGHVSICVSATSSSYTCMSQSGGKTKLVEKKNYNGVWGFIHPVYSDGPEVTPTVTFSNYQVRKLTETSAEPYATATATNGKVARVGMFIGESKNSMIELGTDNGTPKAKKNMWYNTTKYGYPLEPGTTYYYQPYAEVNGKRYDGDVNSFTTPGEKYVPEPEPEPIVTPEPDPEPVPPSPSQEPSEPTYTALVTCNADNLNVRKGPGTNYDKVGSLKRGNKCTVYPNKASGGWSWVEGSGISGYVSTDRLTTFTGNTRTGIVTCNADVLNVRKGPGTSYDKVGQIPNGASCTVYLDVKADWYFVTYGDIAGYASKNKITLK